jgi:alpha-D-ribose 1-methylphosphonate 5-triphosphate synthase subunit PhnG
MADPDSIETASAGEQQPHPERQLWMAVLARAGSADILAHLAECPALPGYRRLRGPEAGLVMVQGRQGGGGSAFNLGEMTVTRCTVRTECGWTGHAYVAGRDAKQAELAAVLDALLQDPARSAVLAQRVIDPLAAAQREGRDRKARKAAATKVQFFTLATMRT